MSTTIRPAGIADLAAMAQVAAIAQAGPATYILYFGLAERWSSTHFTTSLVEEPATPI